MDELDAINKRLLATLNRDEPEAVEAKPDEKADADDFDCEREAPLEEEKFQEINNSDLAELTTAK